MTTLHELRILSGLQAGARLRLTDGVYRLGHGDDCDVVIAGNGINEEALELAIDGDSIVVTPLQLGCGISLTDNLIEPFSLSLGQVFHLAELWLVIDKEDAPWLEQRAWLQMAEAQEAQNKVAQDVQTLPIEEAAEPTLADQPISSTQPVQTAVPETDVSATAPLPQTPYARWLTIACVATLIGGSVLAYTLKQSNDASELKKANASLAAKTIKTSQISVPAIDKTSPNLSNVVGLAKPEHSHILVLQTPSSPKASIPAPEALEELKRQLKASQLGELLNVTRVDNSIDIAGDLDTAQLRRFEEVLLHFVKKYGEILSINAQFLPPERHLPFSIKQIVSGSMPHIVTNDNVKIFEGGVYKGYRLAAIREHKLVFNGKRSIELAW